ncbi:hypothetical protein SETIT_8G242100v2 [Setaria italica]|uniref:DUF4220 domain-containing protein n=3 Tax=Setaria italica TaxID=4555 RepID=A0A368SB48_SETIT|nr:hypothetical protein SETIT_8G242100v2 [Setaria italica]
MDLAPSPPTPGPYSKDQCLKDYTDTVKTYVILAVLAMFLLHVLGSLRRRSSHTLLHSIVMGVYTFSYPLVGYTVGLMKSSSLYYEDFTVWAVFLLLLLGTTDNLTVCRLSDVDNWKSIHVKHILKGFWLVVIILRISNNEDWIYGKKLPYRYPLYAIVLVVILKGYVRIASMRMVSKSYLCKKVKVIAEYMQQQHKDNLAVPFDPVIMEGYRYIVAGEKYYMKRWPGCTPCYKGGDLMVITVEKIWQCTGRLLVLERGKLLKDLCLSMALSKMLNRRFVGFRLSEAGHEKTHDFVFKGLLAGDRPHQRAFRVIEEELVFVHDFYYTRYSYLYQKGRYIALCLPIVMLALCSWLTYLLVKHYESRSVQAATIFVTVIVAFLEAYQLYLYISSGWFKVALIQSYINTPFLRRSRCLEMIIGLLLRLKAFAPWKRNLGQYCILQEVGRKHRARNCLHYATLRLLDKASKNGLKKSEKVSETVKKAIVDSLLGSNGNLTNGVTSLQNNGVNFLSWACDVSTTDGAVARTIVVWHIATTLCEQKLNKQAKEEDAVETASTLSKYCMHLLAFAPNLMPDHIFISESILDQSINEASKLLKEAKDKKIKGKNKKIEGRCEILMEVNTHGCVGDEKKLVAQGVHLARQLIDDIQDFKTRWKVLSDFWAEMMLYVSPSDDAREHLEVLAKGGEFITHLWALLTHAGVLKRGRTEAKDVV